MLVNLKYRVIIYTHTQSQTGLKACRHFKIDSLPDSPESWFSGGFGFFLKLVKQEFPEGSQSAGN